MNFGAIVPGIAIFPSATGTFVCCTLGTVCACTGRVYWHEQRTKTKHQRNYTGQSNQCHISPSGQITPRRSRKFITQYPKNLNAKSTESTRKRKGIMEAWLTAVIAVSSVVGFMLLIFLLILLLRWWARGPSSGSDIVKRLDGKVSSNCNR